MKSMTGNNSVTYRPLTLADFEKFYGEYRTTSSVRGIAFFVDGKLSSIAGIKYEKGFFYAFSDIDGNVKVSKQTIWRCAVLVKEFMKNIKVDVYACANEEIAGAPAFLKRLGFEKKDNIYVMEAT